MITLYGRPQPNECFQPGPLWVVASHQRERRYRPKVRCMSALPQEAEGTLTHFLEPETRCQRKRSFDRRSGASGT